MGETLNFAISICIVPRSGTKDMKSSQQYPKRFGEHVAKYHLEHMQSVAGCSTSSF